MATHGDHRGRDCNGFQVSLNQEIEISQSVTGERQEKQNPVQCQPGSRTPSTAQGLAASCKHREEGW